MKGRAALALLATLFASNAAGRPEPARRLTAAGLELFPDHGLPGRYYYLPLGLELLRGSDGEPGLDLLQVRYLGRYATADEGTALFRSLLTFRVGLLAPGPAAVEAARHALSRRAGRRAEVHPLPIHHAETTLLLATPGDPGAGTPLPAGHLEAAGDEGRSSRTAYWSERRYSVRLDASSAQLVAAALERGQALFSLSYAFFAEIVAGAVPGELASSGGGRGGPELPAAGPHSGERAVVPVVTGTAAIEADAGRWPRLIRKVDLNDRLPPAYAALDVLCFAFRDRLRPELAVRRVEVVAEGVAGDPVRREVLFEESDPDLVSASLRFPFAVRLDRPYRYRTIDVLRDGSAATGPWRSVVSWTPLLDVTGGAPPPPGEAQP